MPIPTERQRENRVALSTLIRTMPPRDVAELIPAMLQERGDLMDPAFDKMFKELKDLEWSMI